MSGKWGEAQFACCGIETEIIELMVVKSINQKKMKPGAAAEPWARSRAAGARMRCASASVRRARPYPFLIWLKEALRMCPPGLQTPATQPGPHG